MYCMYPPEPYTYTYDAVKVFVSIFFKKNEQVTLSVGRGYTRVQYGIAK